MKIERIAEVPSSILGRATKVKTDKEYTLVRFLLTGI